MKPVKPQKVPKESFIAQFLARRLVPELSPIKVDTFELFLRWIRSTAIKQVGLFEPQRADPCPSLTRILAARVLAQVSPSIAPV